jgi:chromosome segregation ATPase
MTVWSCDERNLKIMKLKSLMTVILPLVVLTVGCHKEPTAGEQIDKAKSETATAAQDMKTYAFAQKAEFVTKMQGQLDALNKDLDKLSAKIDSSSDAVKADAKPKLQALRDQTSELTKRLDNVRNATESTWDSVKAASEKAFDSVKDGFQQARQWASDKIAP